MTIIYLTSTGNCLATARAFEGEVRSIFKSAGMIKDDAIGIVFPVYGLCVPPVMREFLKSTIFDTPYLFAVATYGFYAGGVVKHLESLPLKRDRHFDAIFTLKAVENYLPGYEMAKEKAKCPDGVDKVKLASLVNQVAHRDHVVEKVSLFSSWMTTLHLKASAFAIGVGKTRKFTVSSTCASCGTCASLCPMGNIRMVDGRPIFGTNCTTCLGCLQNCPEGALHVEGEKSAERYRNPTVTLQDLVEANRKV